jgi:hypothetical protein
MVFTEALMARTCAKCCALHERCNAMQCNAMHRNQQYSSRHAVLCGMLWLATCHRMD